MKIGYIQNSPIFGEVEENFAQVDELSNGIKADLIVLPELFATGYTFTSKEEALKLAEDVDGKTANFLKKISQKTGATIVGGFIEEEDSKIYNAAIMVNADKVISTYRKIHLYFKEKKWFSPGNRPFEVHQVNDMKLGMMICFDWIFPESMRSLALLGADVIAHPANLVLPYCQNAMITRCLENRVFSITANRIGIEKRGQNKFKFTGGSQITAIDGEILSSGPIDKISVKVIEIDINKARNKALNERNDLFNDRKPHFYSLG